ncbi:MAG: hypothetical protein V3T77_09145 [Planctomycetota bacterium]
MKRLPRYEMENGIYDSIQAELVDTKRIEKSQFLRWENPCHWCKAQDAAKLEQENQQLLTRQEKMASDYVDRLEELRALKMELKQERG